MGVIFDHFSLFFSIKKLVDFSTDFSSIFGWILGVRISENEHLVQARRSFSQNRLFRFWHDFGTKSFQNGGKMASKFNQKINAIFESKNVGFGSQNGTQMEPKWTPKSRKFVDISGYPPKTPPRRPNGGQGARKWSQNGAQREPNGGKMEVKASQNGPKIDEKRGPSVNPHLK